MTRVDARENLFRRESGRLVATLTRLFGIHNLALAEDVAQDTLVAAFELWKIDGVPEHHAAWLAAAAKNRALSVLRREGTARKYAPELTRRLESEQEHAPLVDELFAAHVIRDDQLRMIFSCCHPLLVHEAQVALILRILCGFSVGEIASAFTEPSEYHLESAIAALYAAAPSAAETRWADIVSLYDILMRLKPSPVVALNRAIAVAQSQGPARGLEAIQAIEQRDRLASYPFYPAALGELELRRGRHAVARDHFVEAVTLARSPMERRFLADRVAACDDASPGPRGQER